MIAITGASGLLGRFVAERFLSEGEHVIALKRKDSNINVFSQHKNMNWLEADVSDSTALSESFKGVSTVIHSAAMVSFNPRRAKEVYETNVTGTRNVVDACLSSGVKKLIHISSVAALGRQKGVNQVNERNNWLDNALNSDYAISKYLAELEVYRGHEEGLQVSLVNPSVILGPADWNRSSSKLFKYIWEESPFYTDGILNYVDVRDVASMVYILHISDFNGERFIANAGHTSFRNLFDEIACRFKKRSPFLKVNSSLTGVVASLEAIRCFITNKEPVITKHTVRMAREPFYFENKKAVEKLKINFRQLDEILEFCCSYYAQKITTNK